MTKEERLSYLAIKSFLDESRRKRKDPATTDPLILLIEEEECGEKKTLMEMKIAMQKRNWDEYIKNI